MVTTSPTIAQLPGSNSVSPFHRVLHQLPGVGRVPAVIGAIQQVHIKYQVPVNSRDEIMEFIKELSCNKRIDKNFKMTSDATTNAVKHVMSSVACTRSQWHTKDTVFSLAKMTLYVMTVIISCLLSRPNVYSVGFDKQVVDTSILPYLIVLSFDNINIFVLYYLSYLCYTQ